MTTAIGDSEAFIGNFPLPHCPLFHVQEEWRRGGGIVCRVIRPPSRERAGHAAEPAGGDTVRLESLTFPQREAYQKSAIAEKPTPAQAAVPFPPDTKQAVNEVIQQLVATGDFEEGCFLCPDSGRMCKGIRLR